MKASEIKGAVQLGEPTPVIREGTQPLFSLEEIDLTATYAGADAIERIIPHRGQMRLLDRVIWIAPDAKRAVGVREVRDTEFWVPGHFPGKPMFPGVLMVESGAQLAVYQWNFHKPIPELAAFLRIENCAFRRSVDPGQDLILLCEVIKQGKRRFITDLQGIVDDQVAFEARISGMSLGESQV